MNKWLVLCLVFLFVFDAQAFRYASPDYQYQFPRDHGAHKDFAIEWWYYTGHLKGDDGQNYGFQWTFFRNSTHLLKKENSVNPFSSNQVYFSHATLLNQSKDIFYFAEARSRGFMGEAHASEEGLDLKIKNWQGLDEPDGHLITAFGKNFSYRLKLKPTQNLVFHGKNGVTYKGGDSKNASHYLSYTRMTVVGEIIVEGQAVQVQGQAWMDHEFSSSQLAPGAVGWDWFSIQLDDQSELMIYLLRKKDGSYFSASSASHISKQGQVTEYALSDLNYKILETHQVQPSGHRYPSQFNILIKPLELSLNIKVLSRTSEIHSKESTAVTYWESPISVEAQYKNDKPFKGQGYIELTGYADESLGDKI